MSLLKNSGLCIVLFLTFKAHILEKFRTLHVQVFTDHSLQQLPVTRKNKLTQKNQEIVKLID